MRRSPIPRKQFGQHFLSDQSIIHRIIDTLMPAPGDHLIEIGLGQGALTVPLLAMFNQKAIHQATCLEVVELDRDLIPVLEARTRPHGELIVHAADALTVDFAQLKTDERLLRVFGNLPYNISTPLIFHLLTFAPSISDMLFMLQKEVAERLAAAPSSSDYGRLSVMVQYHCQVDLLFDVPPHAFYPPPQVQSSIVRLLPYRQLPHIAKNYALFERVVKQAFNQRRKTLRNSLRGWVTDKIWEQLSISPQWRPENLSVKAFVEMSNCLSESDV